MNLKFKRLNGDVEVDYDPVDVVTVVGEGDLDSPLPMPVLVPLYELISHEDYQREVAAARFNRYNKRYDRRLVGALFVARRRDLSLHILDGQAREQLIAVNHGRNVNVPCFIIDVESEKEEHDLYVILNKERVSLTPLDYFRVQALDGDPVAIGVMDALRAGGFEPTLSASEYGPLTINAYKEPTHIYNKHGGAEHLTACCRWLLDMFPEDTGVKDAQAMWMASHFIRTFSVCPGFSIDILRKIARVRTVREIALAVVHESGGFRAHGIRNQMSGNNVERGTKLSTRLALYYDDSPLTKGKRKLLNSVGKVVSK